MSENKQIKFAFVVDERSALQAKRVISELIASAQKLSQTLAGVTLGGGGTGGLIAGNVGGPMSQQRMLSGAQGQSQQGGSLAKVFLDNANSLKNLANIGKDSMRVMSDGIKRAVDEQKRSLSDLDSQLAKLAKRYDELGNRKRAAIASGMSPGAAADLYDRDYGGGIRREQVGLLGQRSQMQSEMAKLDEQRRQIAIASDPYSGSGGSGDEPPPSWGDRYGGSAFGKRFPLRIGGKLARIGVVAGSIAAGSSAVAQELSNSPFDFVTQSARQQQALGTMGVSTKQGDLRYAAALMQVMRDPSMRQEFLKVGQQDRVTASVGTAGAFGKIFGGDFNVPGNVKSALEGVDSTNKERLRSYMEQQIQGDPDFYQKLGKFQGEAGGRLGMMRRMGFGENGLSSVIAAAGENGQDIGSAFEAVRGGGTGFARKNMFKMLSVLRGGGNAGVFGDMLTEAMPGGQGGNLLAGAMGGQDIVIAEKLAQAVGSSLRGAQYGAGQGTGILGALSYNPSGSALTAYDVDQRTAAMPALGNFLGGKGDGLGTGINVLAAQKIAGGDLYKANTLAQLGSDPDALYSAMQGRVSPELQAMGVTQGDAKAMFQETMTRNIKARLLTGESSTPAMKAMEKLANGYGGDVGAFMNGELAAGGNSKTLLSQLDAGMKAIMPGMGHTGMAAMLAGAGNSLNVFGRGPGDAGYNSVSRKYERERQQGQEKEFGSFMLAQKEFLTTLSLNMQTFGKGFQAMGNIDQSAEHASQSLVALAAAADDITRKLGGKPPDPKEIEKQKNKNLSKMDGSKATPHIRTLLNMRKNGLSISDQGRADLTAAGY